MTVVDTLQVVLETVGDRAIATLKTFDRQIELARASFRKFTQDITVQSQISAASFLGGFGKIGDWLSDASPTLQAYGDVAGVAFTDFAETVTSDTAPALDTATGSIQGTVDAYKSLPEPVRTTASAIIASTVAVAAGVAVWSLLGPTVMATGAVLGGFGMSLIGAAGPGVALTYAMEGLVPALAGVAVAFAPVIIAVVALWGAWETNFGSIRKHTQTVFDAVRLIIDNIMKVVGGIIDFFVGVFTGDWAKVDKAIDSVISGVAGLFSAGWKLVVEGIGGFLVDAGKALLEGGPKLVMNLITGIGMLAYKVGEALWGLIPEPFRSWIGGGASAVAGIASGAAHAVGGVLGFAEGGIVTQPTLAMVGERGPEAIVPLGSGGVGGNITVQVFVDHVSNDIDMRNLAYQVAEVLHQTQSAFNGGLGVTR